ncbi:sodium:proton antiporter, partial [Mammaliicoccus sciuri]|nr:sodium:proton antiporter [Mammaliicoccus sciuri]
MEINAVLVAVIVMIILCLMRLNVVLSIFIGALTGGLLSGMSVDKVISTFGKTIIDGSEVALSYALLGGFAALISYSGITDYIVGKIITSMKKENSQKSRLKIKILLVAVLL